MNAKPIFLPIFICGIVATALAQRPVCNRPADNSVASFSVNNNVATMNGIIDGSTPNAVRNLLQNFPNVDTINLDNVPGSDDDEANLEAARLIRAAGIKTHILNNGLVASGGVDFFLAGVERSIDAGVCEVGVHSWAGGGITNAANLPRSSDEHLFYLRYYRDIGIDDEFYFFTLNAADANNIYNMDDMEIASFAMTGTAFATSPVRPDLRFGKKSNPSSHGKNNTYSGSGAGQGVRVRGKGNKAARFFFSVENDSNFFDYMRLRNDFSKRGLRLKVFRLTGGRRNVSSAVAGGGLSLSSMNAGEVIVFQFVAKAKRGASKSQKRITFSATSRLGGTRDVARVSIR